MNNDQVGKYRLIVKLGEGGMASVYLSVVPGPAGVNKLLVVKLLKPELAKDTDFISMFVNEARLATRLNHANVVTTYEVGIDGTEHYLAMEYLDGQPLNSILRKTRRVEMPLDIHVRILADTLAGLEYAHTLTDFDGTHLAVVHRDISPQNIFVTYDGQAKVVDFGIAKAAGAVSTTQSGVFKGKLSYIAPEQVAGEPVDHRADLFSVGVMLWEAMANRRFVQGDSQSVIVARRMAGSEPRIREVLPDADPELADICDRALARDPAHRFASARQFQDALEGFLDRFSRRVGRREVGDLVSTLFHTERAKIRAAIDEQIKLLLKMTSTTLQRTALDMDVGPNGEPTALQPAVARRERNAVPTLPPVDTGAGASNVGSGTFNAATISSSNQPAVATPPRKDRWVLPGLAVLTLLAVGSVGALVVTMKSQATSGSNSANTTTAQASSTAPSSKEAADRIGVRIEFPSGATAKLDGVELTKNPFVAKVERDGSMHKLEVSAAGMATKTLMITYDQEVSETIALEAAPAADASASASPSASPSTTAWSTRPTARASTTTSGKRTPLRIDEEDPYKK
ncbi:MAG: serine/threonine-protein kinase [Polyangiaceae bacterium]